ncbi:hypothetical protein EYF80_053157 [Liparis tanakae]|uniref:Uncharacterized protein n=1 Tax=Liparis tanakae TaxID=230148 RepID=A0A4Z2F6J1_9TELE|nr:hypothetical protein EYF80_053157 [Liparis tanakae]
MQVGEQVCAGEPAVVAVLLNARLLEAEHRVQHSILMLRCHSQQIHHFEPNHLEAKQTPQSQAPPAWLRNMLKSWPVWSPLLKHSAHRDMHGEMPQVRHRYATKLAVQTKPHRVALS